MLSTSGNPAPRVLGEIAPKTSAEIAEQSKQRQLRLKKKEALLTLTKLRDFGPCEIAKTSNPGNYSRDQGVTGSAGVGDCRPYRELFSRNLVSIVNDWGVEAATWQCRKT